MAKFAEIVKSEVQLLRIYLPRTPSEQGLLVPRDVGTFLCSREVSSRPRTILQTAEVR